jgi:zinc protease
MTIAIRPAPGPAREYHFPRFSRTKITNGINVVVAPVTKLPLVSVIALIDATALSDPQGKEGVAELTAQAIREGTAARDGVRLALDLEKLGTSLETGADWDSTVASMTVLKQNLRQAFGIMAETLLSPAFREEDITRLKAERLAERMQILDEPRGLAEESFARFLYSTDSRYARPMSGNTQSISAITHDDVEQFYRENYSPSVMTVIFAGDISESEANELVSTTLGSWSQGRSGKRRPAGEAARKNRAVEIVAKDDAAQSELRVGHGGVPRTHPDYFAIVVMNAVLGGLFSSRINLNLREAHGYTYGASSYYDWRREAGPFVISTAVQSEVTAAAISETLKEIDAIRENEIAHDELTLATSYLEGVFPIRYETTSAIAAALANLVTFGLPENYFDTYRSNIARVTTADVLNAARNHVKPEELQIVVVGNADVIREPIEALSFGPVTVRDSSEE